MCSFLRKYLLKLIEDEAEKLPPDLGKQLRKILPVMKQLSLKTAKYSSQAIKATLRTVPYVTKTALRILSVVSRLVMYILSIYSAILTIYSSSQSGQSFKNPATNRADGSDCCSCLRACCGGNEQEVAGRTFGRALSSLSRLLPFWLTNFGLVSAFLKIRVTGKKFFKILNFSGHNTGSEVQQNETDNQSHIDINQGEFFGRERVSLGHDRGVILGGVRDLLYKAGALVLVYLSLKTATYSEKSNLLATGFLHA